MTDTLFVSNVNYRTLLGSTITTSTMTVSSITVSTMTASTIFSATGQTALGNNVSYPNRFVEVGSDTANSIYLDFHSSDAALPDYSTRIQSLGGATSGTGNLNMYASTIGLMPTVGVGIGTTVPQTGMHLRTFTGYSSAGQAAIFESALGAINKEQRLTILINNNDATGGSATGSYSAIQSAMNNVANTPLVLQPNGSNVGIGITNPSVPFYVNTAANINISGGSWTAYNYNTAGFAGPFSTAQNISAYFSAYASSGLGFLIYSDRRIKKDIEPATNCLDIVMKLHPVTYRKKNIMEDGNELHTGFIAQDVEEVYPSAIKKRTDTIPSIYEIRHAILIENGIQITEPIDVPLDAKVVVIDFSNKKITMIHRPDNVLLFENQSDKIELDGDKVFIFGHEVSDKLMLNHDTLFAVGIGAIKELAGQTAQLSAENTELKSSIALLEARLAALESK